MTTSIDKIMVEGEQRNEGFKASQEIERECEIYEYAESAFMNLKLL